MLACKIALTLTFNISHTSILFIEIKNYLYNHLEYLLDYDNHSFISIYKII
jgi:hypothetical protein